MSGAAGRVVVVRRGHTVVPNATVYDERLSYAALGVLLCLLSRPNDRDVPMGYRAMVGRGLGEKATRDALRELDDAGYRHLFTHAAGRKGMRTDVVIAESPISREEAERELYGRPLAPVDKSVGNAHRAAEAAARSDLRKRSVSAGPIVRQLSQHDGSRRDGTPHASKEAQVPSGTGNSNACARTTKPGAACTSPACATAEDCPHGTPHATACALCRRGATEPKF